MKDYEGEFERTEGAAVAGAAPCSAEEKFYSGFGAWKTDKATPSQEQVRIKALRDALIFIAGQGCEGDTGGYAQCKDLPSNPCVTEYCIPCYAAAALESDDKVVEKSFPPNSNYPPPRSHNTKPSPPTKG